MDIEPVKLNKNSVAFVKGEAKKAITSLKGREQEPSLQNGSRESELQWKEPLGITWSEPVLHASANRRLNVDARSGPPASPTGPRSRRAEAPIFKGTAQTSARQVNQINVLQGQGHNTPPNESSHMPQAPSRGTIVPAGDNARQQTYTGGYMYQRSWDPDYRSPHGYASKVIPQKEAHLDGYPTSQTSIYQSNTTGYRNQVPQMPVNTYAEPVASRLNQVMMEGGSQAATTHQNGLPQEWAAQTNTLPPQRAMGWNGSERAQRAAYRPYEGPARLTHPGMER